MSDTWEVNRLEHRVEKLERELESAQRESALRQRSAQRRDQAIDGLTQQVRLLRELSDLRDELGFFVDDEQIRRRVRRELTSLEIVGDSSRASGRPGVVTSDAPTGYWLEPVARALPGLVAGDRETGPDPDVQAARRLDSARTDRFIVLALLLAGRGERAAPHLAGALGHPVDGEVTVEQRCMWVAAARGRLGVAGRRHLTDWLRHHLSGREAVDRLQLDGWHRDLVRVDEPFLGTVATGIRWPHRAALRPLAVAIAAVDALSGLAERYRRSVETPPDGSGPPTPGPRPSPPPGPPSADGLVALEDQLHRNLITLVDEGAGDEAPLLRRVEIIRRLLDTDDQPTAALTGRDPGETLGDLGELVLADGVGRPAPDDVGVSSLDDDLGAVAWLVVERPLTELCARLDRTARELPDIDPVLEVDVGGDTVAVSRGGSPTAEAAVTAAADRRYPPREGLLSMFSKSTSDERDRYRRRRLEEIDAVQAALRIVGTELETARRTRRRAMELLAPVGLGPADTGPDAQEVPS